MPLRDAIADLAGEVGGDGAALATAQAVMAAVRARMTYETGSTDVETLANEALAAGSRRLPGLRARDDRRLPAERDPGPLRQRLPLRRGLRTGTATPPRTRGSTSSTPTAAGSRSTPRTTASRPRHYVRVGVGRDYADVPPTRGVFKGQANEELEVAVRIREL